MGISKEQRIYLDQIGISKKWYSKTFDGFSNDVKAKAKFQKLRKNWRSSLSEGLGAFIYGPLGVGKSHLLNTFFMERAICSESPSRVKVVTFANVINKYTSAWYDKADYREFHKVLKSIQFLGIESLGREFTKTDGNSLPVKVLETVLEIRLNAKLPLFVTSTFTPEEIADRYSEDAASMFSEAMIPVKVLGEDMRTVELGKKLDKLR